VRCHCCNDPLTDYEATIKDVYGHPVDLCLECLGVTGEQIPGVTYHDRIDLRSEGFDIDYIPGDNENG